MGSGSAPGLLAPGLLQVEEEEMGRRGVVGRGAQVAWRGLWGQVGTPWRGGLRGAPGDDACSSDHHEPTLPPPSWGGDGPGAEAPLSQGMGCRVLGEVQAQPRSRPTPSPREAWPSFAGSKGKTHFALGSQPEGGVPVLREGKGVGQRGC